MLPRPHAYLLIISPQSSRKFEEVQVSLGWAVQSSTRHQAWMRTPGGWQCRCQHPREQWKQKHEPPGSRVSPHPLPNPTFTQQSPSRTKSFTLRQFPPSVALGVLCSN